MKIKNANGLLGFIIRNADKNGDITSDVMSKSSGCDDYTLMVLLRELASKHYIILTMDTSTVTQLGRLNYKSPAKAVRNVLLRLLTLGIKEVVVFATGVATGVAINYITHLPQ